MLLFCGVDIMTAERVTYTMEKDARVLREYFEDDKNVIKTVDKLIFMKLDELRSLARVCRSSISMFVDEPLAVAGFDRKKCEKMTFLELMGVLQYSDYSPTFNFKNPHEEIRFYNGDVCVTLDDNYLFYADRLAMFLNRACDESVAVRKFMTLPVSRMCEVFGSSLLRFKIVSGYKAVKRMDYDAPDPEGLIVKDVIDACSLAESTAFLPLEPSECYYIFKRSRMLKAVLLIESFYQLYPQVYDIYGLREKYGA